MSGKKISSRKTLKLLYSPSSSVAMIVTYIRTLIITFYLVYIPVSKFQRRLYIADLTNLMILIPLDFILLLTVAFQATMVTFKKGMNYEENRWKVVGQFFKTPVKTSLYLILLIFPFYIGIDELRFLKAVCIMEIYSIVRLFIRMVLNPLHFLVSTELKYLVARAFIIKMLKLMLLTFVSVYIMVSCYNQAFNLRGNVPSSEYTDNYLASIRLSTAYFLFTTFSTIGYGDESPDLEIPFQVIIVMVF